MNCIAPQLAYIHSDAKLEKIYQSDKFILFFWDCGVLMVVVGGMEIMGELGDTQREDPRSNQKTDLTGGYIVEPLPGSWIQIILARIILQVPLRAPR